MPLWARIVELRDLLRRDFLKRDFWNEHALAVAYAALGVAAFVVFVMSSFPYGDALAALLSPAGLTLKFREQHPGLPVGTQLDGIRVTYSTLKGSPPVLESDSVELAPSLGSLLVGRLGFRVRAHLYGGTLKATVSRSGGGTRVAFSVQEIDLRRYRPLSPLGANLAGLLSGNGTAVLGENGLEGSSGNLEVSAKELALRLGTGIPLIAFSDVKGTLTLRGAQVELTGLHGAGADGTMDAEGTLSLAQEPQNSVIALSFRLDPTPRGRERLGFLIRLLPHPPDSRPYTLKGPLIAPFIS